MTLCECNKKITVDLFSNQDTGAIVWDVLRIAPQLTKRPLKLRLLQLQSEFKDDADDNSTLIFYRVIHNIMVSGFCNDFLGLTNSNVLTFFDSYSVRSTIAASHKQGFSNNDISLYCPSGLPNTLILNRMGTNGTTGDDSNVDDFALTWAVKLEITILE
jgi:hypothetical protein